METEAYYAANDEACHTFKRPSAREFIERNTAGAAYIYFNYGMHWMLNVLVKGAENGFVLIRALEPKTGIGRMKKRRGTEEERLLCSGPGKLTQSLDINDRHHEMNLCADPRHCFVKGYASADHFAVVDVVADARIGITRSADHPWRFTLRDSKFVSRAAKPR